MLDQRGGQKQIMRSHPHIHQPRGIGNTSAMIKNPGQHQSACGENGQRDGREPTGKQSKQPGGQQGRSIKTHRNQEKESPLSGKQYDLLPPTDSPEKMLHAGWTHSVNLKSDDPTDNVSPMDIQRQSFEMIT